MKFQIIVICLYISLYRILINNLSQTRNSLEINKISNYWYISLHYFIFHINLYQSIKNKKTLEINEIPNPSYDEDHLSYPKRSLNLDCFWEVRSGEEFDLKYVSSPFK